MDAHYHDVEGESVYVPGVHSSKCPVCSQVVVVPAETPVTPIRRPHRKVVKPDEAA